MKKEFYYYSPKVKAILLYPNWAYLVVGSESKGEQDGGIDVPDIDWQN